MAAVTRDCQRSDLVLLLGRQHSHRPYDFVELDNHDILLAESLLVETNLDCGNRRFFANAEATALLAVPDARFEGPLPVCRPFHEAGPVVDLVRAKLEDRAVALGWRKFEETFAGLPRHFYTVVGLTP